MAVKQHQLDGYYWIVQRCLVEFFGQTPLEAQAITEVMRNITAPEVDQQIYHAMAPWQVAACWCIGKESLTPEEQATYDKIVEETFGEDFA